MNEIKIYEDKNELLNALAETIAVLAKDAIQARGKFNFVLSGGSSPKNLYELLASEKFKNKIDWNKTYFFFGDERFVSESDSQRNSLMAQDALFKPLAVKESHIFKVDATYPPEKAAQLYAKAIADHFDHKVIAFDFILLGLGDNAHTASLFPFTEVLHDTEATVRSVFVDEVKMYRITMTAPLINQARCIAFLIFGKEKASAVYHVLEDKEGTFEHYPARLIKQDVKKVLWFLDRTAASLLSTKSEK